jgi:alcohol dehydrogenase class IV
MTDAGSELRKFVAPEFVFGEEARHMAARYALNFGASKVLVVTDPGIIAAGWVRDVTDAIKAAGIPYHIFSGITPNPKAEEVMAGAEEYEREKCDVIVVVGGGSPIDAAKGIGIVSSNKTHILEFEGVDQVPSPGSPLICIPTTAGSGADVSQFAIITDTCRKVKIAIISKTVVPDVSLIDPATLSTMPRELTAHTGMDALAHAFEAYVSNAGSAITDLFSLEAVRLISSSLIPSIESPENQAVRSKAMLASLYAGLAFSNAGLGLIHAMAHTLGGYLDIPHGESNSILISRVISFNMEAAQERYTTLGKMLCENIAGLKGCTDADNVFGILDNLRKTLNVDVSLGKLGIKPGDIPVLAAQAIKDPCIATNPRRPTRKEIEELYEQAL